MRTWAGFLAKPTAAANPSFVNVGATTNSTTSASSLSVALPASRVNGNLLLLFCGLGASGITVNTPAGWTSLLQQSADRTMAVFYRYVDGTETAPTVTFTTASSTKAFFIAQYTGVKSGTPFGVTVMDHGASSPRAVSSLTTTALNSTLVLCGWPAGSATNFGSPTNYATDNNSLGSGSPGGYTLYHQNMSTSGGSSTSWSAAAQALVWDACTIELLAA